MYHLPQRIGAWVWVWYVQVSNVCWLIACCIAECTLPPSPWTSRKWLGATSLCVCSVLSECFWIDLFVLFFLCIFCACACVHLCACVYEVQMHLLVDGITAKPPLLQLVLWGEIGMAPLFGLRRGSVSRAFPVWLFVLEFVQAWQKERIRQVV